MAERGATDMLGYRQDQARRDAMSRILEDVLTEKEPLLQSPGTILPGLFYYDKYTSSVQAAEMMNFFGKNRIQFNGKSFGTSPSVSIPNGIFCGTPFLYARLNTAATWNNDVVATGNAGLYLPHGWLWNAVDSIIYYLGSSSVANVQISGLANYLFMAATCETAEKKQTMLDMGGKYVNTGDGAYTVSHLAAPIGNQGPDPGTAQFVFRSAQGLTASFSNTVLISPNVNVVDTSLAVGLIPLRLPFASMACLEKRLSFDTKLLAQPIQITVSLKPASGCMQFNGIDGGIDSEFEQLSLISYEQALSDSSLSLKTEIMRNPAKGTCLPFQYLQDMPFQVPVNQDASGGYTVNITSMLNADLTTILFAVQWGNDLMNTHRFAPMQFIQLYELELILNGQRLHYYPDDTWLGVMNSQTVGSPWPTCLSRASSSNGGLETFATPSAADLTVRQPQYFYEIDFSRLRAVVMESHLMNTPRFTNQTMQLRFKVVDGIPNFPPGTAAADKNKLTVRLQYSYNGTFVYGQDGGQSKLYTS